MNKGWEIANVEELSPEEQQAYIDRLKLKYDEKIIKREGLWRKIFIGAFMGILGGAVMIGLGGDAYNGIGSATIIGSAIAELGIMFGALWNVSDLEMAAKAEIESVEKRINKKR